MVGEMVGTNNRGHPACKFAHGFKEGQAAADLEGFVGDRGATAGGESLGKCLVGGKVQVSEKRMFFSKHGYFSGLRLFHLHDEFSLLENGGGGGSNLRSCGLVLRVEIAGVRAGTRLYHHPVSALHQFTCRSWNHAHAVLL